MNPQCSRQPCLDLNDRPQHKLSSKERALFAAVRRNDAAKVRELIAQGANVNACQTPKRTWEFNLAPLHEAALNQNAQIVRLLLEAGANVHAESGHLQDMGSPGETALNWVCGFRSPEVVNLDVVRLLLQYGANPNHRMYKNRKSVFECSIYRGRIEVVRLMLEAGAEVNAQPGAFTSPLIQAAETGDAEIATELLRRGAEVNYQNWAGRAALSEAADRGAKDVVALLLQHGADPNLRDQHGQTALILAATKCGGLYVREENETKYFPIVKLLVEAKADLNVLDHYGRTALEWAEDNPHEDRPDLAKNFFAECAAYLRSVGAKRWNELT